MIEGSSSVLVVGSVAVDWVITPTAEREQSVGGSATFFSMAASYFGPVRLLGVVGSDFPEQAVTDLKGRGVDTSGLEVVPDGKTFRWKGRYHDNMNERDTLDTQLNVFEKFDPKLPAAYRETDLLFLANIQPDLQLRVLDQMTGPRLVGLDTMNLWIGTARAKLLQVLARVDVLMINEEEARQLTEEPNLVKAAAMIGRMGPKTIVIKRGEYGALLFHDGDVFCAPALPLAAVVDPTGAGDSFAGGFMGTLCRGAGDFSVQRMRSAMIYGSVLASFCVEGFSYDRIAQLDAAQIDARYETFTNLTRFQGARLSG